MDRETRLIVTQRYLRTRRIRRWIALMVFTLIAVSVALTYAGTFGRCGDDWAKYDRQTFRVTRVTSGDLIQISVANGSLETVRLLGVASPTAGAQQWLSDRIAGRDVTLLLQSPQTRDASGSLLAFVFIGHADLSVDLTAAGLIFADRRERTVMDGLIDPAEATARKKKLGVWADLRFDQMPQWRKDWLRSLPRRVGSEN
jgi:endonuclease YncB( thermonuclease family)